MDINAEVAAKTEKIEAVIARYLPKEEGYQKTVISAMNYSIQAGGKRLRPMLMWETYRMFGGRSEVIGPFMAAIEMVHTYSLVHDDLPAMDNDEFRRGRKTTHAQYGEAMGILAGDGLLNYAFETAVKAFEIEPGNLQIGKALAVLAEKSGCQGMLGGQCVDVEMEGKPVTEDMLRFIYRLKTAALFEASMLIGAILAGATQSEQRQVELAAREFGLAFQIQDDILDVTSTAEVLGKPVFSDERNQKTTYVTCRGIDECRRLVEEVSKEALQGLSALGGHQNEFLRQLLIWLISRER